MPNFSLQDGKVAVTLKFPRDFTIAFDLHVENPYVLTLMLMTVLRKVRCNKVQLHMKVEVNLWVEWRNIGSRMIFVPGYMH